VHYLQRQGVDYAKSQTFNYIYNTFNLFEKRIYERYLLEVGKVSTPQTESQNNNTATDNTNSDYYSKLPEYMGKVSVASMAPILEEPDQTKGKKLGVVEDNTATVIRKENNKYYYVSSVPLN